jgi:uncharacterized membrane protein
MARGVLVFFELLTASVWIGGLVVIAIVARIVRAQLDPSEQVAFFRALGRSYGKVGTIALGLALAFGAALLTQRSADAAVVASVLLALILVVTTGVAMRQARAMTRLRSRGLGDPDLDSAILAGARRAALCRFAIAGLTLLLLAVASALAS